MKRGYKGWKGPLADAVEGMSREALAVAMDVTTVTVDKYMRDPEKQRGIPIDMLAGIHRAVGPKCKARIEKFINDQLVA